MAFTLADYRTKETQPLTAAVIDTFRKESALMNDLPFPTVASMAAKIIRTKSSPTPGWRQIGEDHTSSIGAVEPVEENVYSIGNYVDLDKVLYMDKNQMFDQRTKWVKDTIKAIAFNFHNYFINGAPTTDLDAITGLHYRLQNDIIGTYTEQQFVAKTGGSGLDVSPDAASLSDALNTLIDQIDAAIDLCPDGVATHILLNNTLKQRFSSAARQLSLWSQTQDSLGRVVDTYRGAKIIDVGNSTPDGTTKVIGNAESLTVPATLTGGTGTSAYVMRLGEEYLTAFQEYPISTTPWFELEDRVTWRCVIDWAVGLMLVNPRSVVRVYGIVAA